VGLALVAPVLVWIAVASPAAVKPAGQLVALSIENGKVARAALQVGPSGTAVDSVVADGHNGWWVGGSFKSIDGTQCPYLLHVLPGLRIDRTWCPRPNGEVQRLAASGDTLFAAGPTISRVGSLPRKGVAAIDGRTGSVLPWNPRPDFGVDGRGLAVDGSLLYLTGPFEHIGGKARHQLAALDTRTARANSWNPKPFYTHGDPSVTSIAPAGQVVFLEGYFDGMGESLRQGFAEVDATVGRVLPFRPDGQNAVVANGKLYLLVFPPACTNAGEWVPACAKTTSIAYDLPGLARNRHWKPAAKGVFAADQRYAYAYSALSQYTEPQARETLVAMDPATGALKWRSPVFSQPTNRFVTFTLAASKTYVLVGGDFTRVGR